MAYAGNDFYCDVALKDLSVLKIEYESDSVLAYYHTRPHWPVHIIVIPKKHIPSLTEYDNDEDSKIILEIIKVVQNIAKKVEKEFGGARVQTNLGVYQESKHLHFHISYGEPLK